MVNARTKEIVFTDFCKGKVHDFKLFKDSKILFGKNQKILADSGYLGIKKLHKNAETPKKNTKLHPLSKADKRSNKALSARRIFVENVIGAVKKFRILSQKYRNRRKRFKLRFNLISAIYNFELNSYD